MEKAKKNNLQQGINRWWKKNIIWLILVGIVLLISAGKTDWTAAWLYLGAILLIVLINAIVMDPELMTERASLQEGTARWDLYLSTFVALAGPLITVIIAGLDQRYGWSGEVALWQQLTALLFFLAAGLLGAWAMAVNRFFSATVRIQNDREHIVAKGGPYRVIRHPGYLAGMISILATPVMLESLTALIPALLIAAIYIIRTALEDSFLEKELPGYQDYQSKVQYRLFPGIW